MTLVVLIMWPMFFLVSHVLFNKSGLNIRANTYSDLGAHSKYGTPFNILFISVGTVQLMFLYNTLLKIYDYIGGLGLFCMAITSVAGVLTGIITVKTNKLIHLSIAKTGFLLSILGYILYGCHALRVNIYIGLFMLLWALLITHQIVYKHITTKRVYAKNEFFMFLGAFLTNIALLILYY